MRPGSVIVDLAAEQGGNCAFTVRDEVVEKYGVTIVGLTDLPSRMATQASELYATNLCNLLEDMLRDGQWHHDLEDEVQRGMLVLLDGKLMWPRPKPEARAAAPQPPKPSAAKPAAPPKKEASAWPARIGMLGLAACVYTVDQKLTPLRQPPSLSGSFLLAQVRLDDVFVF